MDVGCHTDSWLVCQTFWSPWLCVEIMNKLTVASLTHGDTQRAGAHGDWDTRRAGTP